VCVAVCGGAFFALAAARGVDAFHVLHALRHIVDSNQAFGRPEIAREYDPSVYWHLAVFPIGVLAVAVLAFAAVRAREKFGPAELFAPIFVLYGAAYYFANFQRGLVRHTWIEVGNVYLLSFGFAVLCTSIYLATSLAPHTKALLFLGVASVLSGSFGLQGPLPANASNYASTWQQALTKRTSTRPVEFVPSVIDRSPTTPFIERRHFAAMRAFVADHLTPAQTFLDLTNSPVLFLITHRRSPQYLNHLLLAGDQWLQRSELTEFARNDIPFVLAAADPDLAALDGVQAGMHNYGDSVHSSVRQWLFQEWLHRGYEPWCVVQRWIVWRRKDWLAPVQPIGTGVRHLAQAQCDAGARQVVLHGATDQAPLARLEPDRIAYLRLDGVATERGSIALRLALSDEHGARRDVVRSLVVEPGDTPRFWTLPCDLGRSTLQSLEIDATQDSAFELRQVVLDDAVAADYATIADRLKLRVTPDLGQAAWLWANRDDGHALAQPVLRELWPASAEAQRSELPLALDARDFPRFSRGIGVKHAAFMLGGSDYAHVPAVGAHVRFASGAERVVERIELPRVYVSGSALDPESDGAPHEVMLIADQAVLSRNSPHLRFEPLDDSAQPCYVALRITRLAREVREAAIVWGAGDRSLGRLDFTLRGDGPQDYLLRVSSQASWARAPCDWIDVPTDNGAFELVAARIIAGD